MSNLISNAIKFTPANSTINVSALEENEKIIIQVKDDGPGIPSHVIENVRNNKESLSSLGPLGEKGSGLGLSITKTFVDSYGGQIEFLNAPVAGLIVKLTLEKAERPHLSQYS